MYSLLVLLAYATTHTSAQTKLSDSLPATHASPDTHPAMHASRHDTLPPVKVVAEKKQAIATNAQSELKGTALFQTSGQTLGEALKSVPGLNSIQTGPSISKPVIHGLHSNRVLILNNGVRQEGQQWGTEHAPEIDPFIANKITIIKGGSQRPLWVRCDRRGITGRTPNAGPCLGA